MGGGQGGCERRINHCENSKNCRMGWGVREDVNEELKLLCKCTKESQVGVCLGVQSGGGGVRVDLNEELKLL